jgi:hypothetical protein
LPSSHPRTICCNVRARNASTGKLLNASGRALQSFLTGPDLPGDLPRQVARCAQRLLQRSNTFFGQACCSVQKRLERTHAATSKVKSPLLVRDEPCQLLLGQSKVCFG